MSMIFSDKKIEKLFTLSKVPQRPINFENGDLIFPFVIKSGFVNSTEQGYVFDDTITDYSRFERIFTGYESILAQWEGSSFLTNNREKTQVIKHFSEGRYILGKEDYSESTNSFEELDFNNDYQVERDVVEIKYNVNGVFSEADVLKLYVMPKKYGNMLFRVKNIVMHPANDTNKILYSTITFISVNSILTKTGLALNQFIQFSAPAEGYAFPSVIERITQETKRDISYTFDKLLGDATKRLAYRSKPILQYDTDLPKAPVDTTNSIGEKYSTTGTYVLNYKNNGVALVAYDFNAKEWYEIANEKGFTVAIDKLRNRPITNMQIEVFGKGVLSDFYVMGRPISETSNSNGEVVNSPRHLFFNRGASPITTQQEATRPLARNTAYYVIERSQLDLLSWWKDWKESIVAEANISKKKEWMGVLKVHYGDYHTKQRSWWEKAAFVVSWPLSGALKHYGIWNPWEDHQTLAKNILTINADNNGVLDIGQMMVQNFFKNKSVLRLPMHYTEQIPWTLKNIPLVGGFLDKLSLGLPIAWSQTNNLGGQDFNITGVVPQTLLDFFLNGVFGLKLIDGKTYGIIPLDGLKDGSEVFMSDGEFATATRVYLTDQFKNSRPKGYNGIMINEDIVLSTKDIGVKRNGETEQSYRDRQLILEGVVPVEKDATTDGFAIDYFGMHFLGAADVKLTFLDKDDNPVYTTLFQTNSKINKSLRDWHTGVKLSSHEYLGEPIDNRIHIVPSGQVFNPDKIDPYGNKVDMTNEFPDGVMYNTTNDQGVDKTTDNGLKNAGVATDLVSKKTFSHDRIYNTGQIEGNIIPVLNVPYIYAGKGTQYKPQTKNLRELLTENGYPSSIVSNYKYITLTAIYEPLTESGAALTLGETGSGANINLGEFKFQILSGGANGYELKLINKNAVDTDNYKVLSDGNIFIFSRTGNFLIPPVGGKMQIKDMTIIK